MIKVISLRYFVVLLTSLFLSLAVNAVAADFLSTVVTQAELMPDEPLTKNHFGYSVAIDGDIAVVGAPYDDLGLGSVQAGIAYVFRRNGNGWEQEEILKTDDASIAANQFGWSVAISGDTIVVGSPGNSEEGFWVGAAYVYIRTNDGWQQQAKLTLNNQNLGSKDSSRFGDSVAIDGDIIAVGIPGKRATAIFERNGTKWQEQAQLTIEESFDSVSSAVAISGKTVVVGMPRVINDITGTAYVFVRENTIWTMQEKLVASNAHAGYKFGTSVAINGNTIAIGAIGDISENSGAVYLFEREGTSWIEKNRFVGSDINNKFGISVALSNNVLLVGASETSEAGDKAGMTYIFTRRGIVWEKHLKLIANNAIPNDEFGNAVAISGDTALIGAHKANNLAGTIYTTNIPTAHWPVPLHPKDDDKVSLFVNTVAVSGDTMVVGSAFSIDNIGIPGVVHVFVRDGMNWIPQAELISPDSDDIKDRFGFSVAISGDTIVVGALGYDNENTNEIGAAYVFVRNGTVWTQQIKLTVPDEDTVWNKISKSLGAEVPIYFGGSVAISEDTIVISAPGLINENLFLGSAYVYEREGTNWQQTNRFELDSADVSDVETLMALDILQTSSTTVIEISRLLSIDWILVAIEENTIAIGIPLKDSSAKNAGAVHVYSREGQNWQESTIFVPSSVDTTLEGFGSAVAINKNRLVVGASGKAKAYVFTHNGNDWIKMQEFVDTNTESDFGISVDISENTILIGAPSDDKIASYAGAVYEYVYNGINWIKKTKLTNNKADTSQLFGLDVAVNGNAKLISVSNLDIANITGYHGIIFPTLTVPSALSGHYATNVSVKLTCTTDCTHTYYTLDGSTPTETSPLYSGPIAINSTTTLKYFSIGASAGPETVTTQTYIIDNNPPDVSINYPENGTTLKTISLINGTAIDKDNDGGSGQLDRIEINIKKIIPNVAANQYANLDEQGNFQGFSDKLTWIRATGTTNWSLLIKNISFDPEQTYHVTARAIDIAGNISSTESTRFTYGDKALTHLSLHISSQTILNNGELTLTGKLKRLPDTGIDLADETITLTVTAPDASQTYTTQTDSLGNYTFHFDKNANIFITKGPYTFNVAFTGDETLLEVNSDSQTVLVGSSAGYAIIVQGRITNNEGMEAYNKTLNRVYQRLLDRGFRSEDIRYFNYDDSQAGVYATPTKTNRDGIEGIQTSIETWLSTKINSVPAPLYIIMVDHGNPDVFYLGDEIIKPPELNSWLDTLESNLNPIALQEPRVVVIGACYSGSFIPALSKTGRTIITSAAGKEVSYKGLKEDDGIRSGEFFIEEFFQQLWRGKSLKNAFVKATESTEMFTRSGILAANTANAYLDDAMQHPLLDDNADGKGSNVLFAEGEGEQAAAIFLGAGTDFQISSDNNPATIIAVTPTTFLSATAKSAPLFLQANTPRRVDPAIIAIRPPSKILRAQDGTGQIDIDLATQFLTANPENIFTTSYNNFSEAGRYEIFYSVRDSETGQISLVKRSLVYKNQPGNLAPKSLELLLPEPEAETRTMLVFDWRNTIDPDGDSLTYTLLLATDADFTNIVHRQEELTSSITVVDDSAGLQDATTYYWQVEAIDSFGAKTVSQIRSFTTNNPSAGYSCVNLPVYDAVTYHHVPNTQFRMTPPAADIAVNVYRDENGYLGCSSVQGEYDVEVDASGYIPWYKKIIMKRRTAFGGMATNANINFQPVIQQKPVFLKPVCSPNCQNPGSLQWWATNNNVNESDSSITLFVQRVDGYDGQVSVDYLLGKNNDTANFGSDYTSDIGTRGTIAWGDRDPQIKSITVFINDDSDVEEPAEFFTLELSNPTGGVTVSEAQIKVTINDNEKPESGTIAFAPAMSQTVLENAASVTISVKRQDGNYGKISVVYMATPSSTATLGSDYSNGEGTVIWQNGESGTKNITINIVDDQIAESTETINLRLLNPSDGVALSGDSQITVTIADNDPIVDKEPIEEDEVEEPVVTTPLPDDTKCPALSPETAIVAGGNTVTSGIDTTTVLDGHIQQELTKNESVTIDIWRVENLDDAVSVKIAVRENPTSAKETLAWQDGENGAKIFTFAVNALLALEAKTFTLMLSKPSGDATVGTQNPTTETVLTTSQPECDISQIEQPNLPITDHDEVTTPSTASPTPPFTIIGETKVAHPFGFSKSHATVDENIGTVEINVSRAGACEGRVRLEHISTAESTATLISDYAYPNEHINNGGTPWQLWQNGECTTKPIVLHITDDTEVEPDEKLILRLVNVHSDPRYEPANQFELTIVDNDESPGTVQFPQWDYRVQSGETALISVTRDEDNHGDISVNWTANELNGMLTWQDGDSSQQSFEIPTNNSLLRGHNLILVNLKDATGGATLGSQNQAVLIIEGLVDTIPDLPYLGEQGMAVENDEQYLPSDAMFRGDFAIRGAIEIAPQHLGEEADILIVIAADKSWYMLGADDELLQWDFELEKLEAYKTVTLQAKHAINIPSSFLPVGKLEIYFGYRLHNGRIEFNGEEPIRLIVNDEL